MTDREQEHKSIPVAVARAAVQASGQLVALEGPHYLSPDGEWLSYILPGIYEAGHPEVARVIIERTGQKPREVVISWAEYEAEIETEQEQAWADGRRLKPMSIFGAEVERHAYRVVFADVLAAAMPPRIIAAADAVKLAPGPDRMMVVPDDRPAAGWDLPERDWLAEVKVADAAKLNALYDEARDAGALVKFPPLQLAFTNRMLELSAAPKLKLAPRPAVTDKPAGQGQRRRRGKRSS